jgi:hypothetical protein
MLVAVRFVTVLLLTEALDLLNVPSRNNEQLRNADSVSVVVKLKLIVEELEIVRLAGLLRVTVGAAVSTVKFQVWLVPVLLALSLHFTYQV